MFIVRRKHNVQKKAFLGKQVSFIPRTNNAMKYKNLGYLTIFWIIKDY